MKKLNFVALALTSLLTLSVFAGCGTDPGPGQIVEPPKTDDSTWHSLENNDVVYITLAGRDVDTEKANYQAFVEEFNNTHDNIVVTLEWWSDSTAYNVALDGMGSNLPDVFMLQNATGMYHRFAAAGKLANIRNYVDEELMNDLYKEAYDIYYYDHATKKPGYSETAGFYGLPKDMGPYALAVNEDLLATTVAAYNKTVSASDQIDINRIMSTTAPMDYDYFLEIGQKLSTVLSNSNYVLAGYNMESAIYSNNADYYTRTDNGWEASITSDNFVEALTFYQNLYRYGILPAAGTESSSDTTFTSGRGIFYYVGPWTTKDWWTSCDFSWNIVPVIAGTAEGAISTAYVGGMCYAISNNCLYKDAALELAKFLATDISSQRTQYKRGQCIPNLVSLAEEYSTDQYGFIASQSGKTNPAPANRSVWIDVVDGSGTTKTDAQGNTYTDVVAGRYSSVAYTINNTWLANFNNYIGGSTITTTTLWKAVNGEWLDVKTVLTSYLPYLQEDLNDMWRTLSSR